MKGCVMELLDHEKVELYWPDIVKKLEECPQIWESWWTLDALHDAASNHMIQCWAVGTKDLIYGVVFSRICCFPTGNFFQIFLSVGERIVESIEEMEATWEKFANYHGCIMAEVSGRPGWEPVLKKRGFKRTGTIMSRPLDRMKVN